MKRIEAQILGAVYIYIYIYIYIEISTKRKISNISNQNIKNILVQAYKKISLILYAKNEIGYIKGVYSKYNSNDMKKIKLLHDSLSFL